MTPGSSDAAGLGTELVLLRVKWKRQVLSPSERESNKVELRGTVPGHHLPRSCTPASSPGGLTNPGSTEAVLALTPLGSGRTGQ